MRKERTLLRIEGDIDLEETKNVRFRNGTPFCQKKDLGIGGGEGRSGEGKRGCRIKQAAKKGKELFCSQKGKERLTGRSD